MLEETNTEGEMTYSRSHHKQLAEPVIKPALLTQISVHSSPSNLRSVEGRVSWLIRQNIICRTSTKKLTCSSCMRYMILVVILLLEIVIVLVLTSRGLGCPNISINGTELKELDF